jgi:DNA-binding MarR family transcriptional regulator
MDGLDPVGEAIRQWRAHDLGSQAHMEAVANVNRLSQLAVARIEACLREYDMTFPQYEALVLLDFATDGALPLGRMGRRLTVHPTTVTNTVDQLERKGLVTREHTPEDRRRVLARITKEGRKRSKASSKALAEIKFGLEGMKVGEAREISGAIAHYREAMGDRV